MSDQARSGTSVGSGPLSNERQLATGLGLFSIGLGLFELLAPHQIGRALGLEGRETLLRAYGARELAAGIAILASPDPTPWLWGRVAGDALDLMTLAQAPRPDSQQKGNLMMATAAVIGVTALDLICAGGLAAEGGGRSASTQPGSNRTGTPDGSGRYAPAAPKGGARATRHAMDLRIEQSSPRLILIHDEAVGHAFRFSVEISGGRRVLGAFAPRWAEGHEPSSAANYLFEARQIAEREAADQGWIDG